MLEGKYQRNGDTKKQKTTINYSMTTTFQLIRGEQMFIFCLLLLSQKAPPPAVWRQRKKVNNARLFRMNYTNNSVAS